MENLQAVEAEEDGMAVVAVPIQQIVAEEALDILEMFLMVL